MIAWGSYWAGGSAYVPMTVPPGLSNVCALDAGSGHAVAVKTDGTMVAWGDNGYGQTNVPVGASNIVAVYCGWSSSMALVGEKTMPPLAEHPACQDSRFNVAVFTERGKAYRLEYKEALSDPQWKMLPPVPGDNSEKTLGDPGPPRRQRFYRIRAQP